MKKVTVTGIIGKTQGVTNAINPPKNPNKKIARILLFWVPSSPQLFTGFFISIAADFILIPEATPPSKTVLKAKGKSGENSSPLLKKTDSLPSNCAGTAFLNSTTAFQFALPSDTINCLLLKRLEVIVFVLPVATKLSNCILLSLKTNSTDAVPSRSCDGANS